ncbi:MAG TPA: hypothetical protein VH253_05800 [Phycisphaerae bacterium]|nr:hypothetical protein [Phycisphaerae bacterium]
MTPAEGRRRALRLLLRAIVIEVALALLLPGLLGSVMWFEGAPSDALTVETFVLGLLAFGFGLSLMVDPLILAWRASAVWCLALLLLATSCLPLAAVMGTIGWFVHHYNLHMH